MRRAAAIALGAVLVGAGAVGVSLVQTGTPAFGLLAGTGLQEALVPAPLRRALAPGDDGSAGRPGRDGPLDVETARVVEGAVPVTLSFSGQLRARRVVELRARVTGYLVERAFEEASFVAAGDVLYRLRTREFEAAVAELEAALEGARSDLAFLERETERVAALEERDFATASRFDELQSQRAGAQARVDELEAELRRARLDLDLAEIEAPFSGKAGFSNVDEGDLVTANDTLLTQLVEYDPIEVEFRPSAEQLAQLQSALDERGTVPVEVRLDGDPETHSGEISGLGAAFDGDTNTIPVRAALANADRKLVPGQFAAVTTALGERPALLVPTRALVANQDQRALYRIDGEGRVEIVPVTTGLKRDERTAVEGDLVAGDHIAVGKLQMLRPGMKVRAIDGGEPASPEAVAGDRPADGRGG